MGVVVPNMPDEESINGRYRLIEVIGQGAMGTVWRGHDEMLDREVAIKKILLPSDLDEQDRAELKALAMREARATARLSHPGIITLFDVIEHDAAPVIVMELLEGESLAEILRQQVRLPWRRVAEIGAAMVEALQEAHSAGIIHRDLKPANVLIAGRRVVITDFGIAQSAGERTVADPGDVTGTPAFMAPEQAENAAASAAADVWALGATLFNAVEGRPPFEGPDYASVLLLLLTQDPPEPRRAGPLRPLIKSLLHKDAALRPTLDEVADQLEALLHEDSNLAALLARAASPPPVRSPATPPATPPVTPAATNATRTGPRAPGHTPAPNMTNSPPAPRARSARRRRRQAVSLGALVLAACLVPVIGHYGRFNEAASSRPGSPPAGGGYDIRRLIGQLAFSPDGRVLAVAGFDIDATSYVELLDVRTHKRLGTLTGMAGADVLAFSPDGGKLALSGDGGLFATGGDDGTIRLWDLKTHRQLAAWS
jgi:serine/threonine protein kinase